MELKTKLKGTMVAMAGLAILGGVGTFAWTSMSQRALNEGGVEHNPGGRIHDDYEGFGSILDSPTGGAVNKDIFAENYSNKSIYVRVKLSEYLEVGDGAGKYSPTGEDHLMVPTADNHATPLTGAGLDEALLEDRSTWVTYLPQGLLPDGTDSKLRDIVTWTLGDTNPERKVYMPTFNQNNQNLESDTTGEAIEELTWTKNANYDTTSKTLLGLQDQWELGEKHISTLRKYDEATSQEVQTPGIEHTAQATLTPDQTDGYMTMEEWLNAGQPTGNFWVHDNDGWIYWANPLKSHSATSLLLDKITVNFPEDDFYYAINVTSDFATSEDLGMWTGVTAEAQSLLDKIK